MLLARGIDHVLCPAAVRRCSIAFDCANNSCNSQSPLLVVVRLSHRRAFGGTSVVVVVGVGNI